jgi:hypothetical protein
MTSALPPAPRASNSWPSASWQVPLAVAVVVFLLVYGSELGQFSLSLDEEAASFPPLPHEIAWLRQGRWGMSLLSLLLPSFEAIPLLSTVLFGAGLVFAAVRASIDFRLDGLRACLFAGVLVGFPLWPHIAQFNTLAGGFGFGIAAAAFGAGLAVRADTLRARALAVLAMAFAISVYQTLALFSVVYAGLALHAAHARPEGRGHRVWIGALLRAAAAAAACVAAAGLTYWLIQRAALAVSGEPLTYIDAYWHTDRLRAAPMETLRLAAAAGFDYLSGRHPIYLDDGARLLFLSWLGLLPWCLLDRADGERGARLGLLWATLAACLAVLFVPFALSAGTLPARAHIAWPLIAAWLAARIVWPAALRPQPVLWTALGYFAICAASVGATLFHADRHAREADAALSQQLVAQAQSVARAGPGAHISFTLVGSTQHPGGGAIRRAEVFGSSFYGHDRGNVCRVALYWRTLGHHGFTPVWLGNRPDLIAAAAQLPAWPSRDAVRLVNGVVIVKLGDATPPQLRPSTCIP